MMDCFRKKATLFFHSFHNKTFIIWLVIKFSLKLLSFVFQLHKLITKILAPD